MSMNLIDLYRTQQEWSQKTFGRPFQRGPVGSLKHLEREAREAQAKPDDVTEYADCFILVLDAAWRAGFSASELYAAVVAKQKENRSRKWPPLESQAADAPVEHLK